MLQVSSGQGIVIYGGRITLPAITLHLVDGAIQAIHVASKPGKLHGVAP